MVAGYQAELWHDLCVAIAGAAAALAGLLFVAVSINLAAILKSTSLLPRRAAEALVVMVAVLLMAILVLTPGQSKVVLGAELLAVGVVGGVGTLVPRMRSFRSREGRLYWSIVPLVDLLATFVPAAAAGVSLLVERGGGLYWLVPAVMAGFVTAVTSAWVLLVEIHR